jgi:uncharacterized membrane protein
MNIFTSTRRSMFFSVALSAAACLLGTAQALAVTPIIVVDNLQPIIIIDNLQPIIIIDDLTPVVD